MEWKEGNIATAREYYQRLLSINSTSENAVRCLQVMIQAEINFNPSLWPCAFAEILISICYRHGVFWNKEWVTFQQLEDYLDPLSI